MQQLHRTECFWRVYWWEQIGISDAWQSEMVLSLLDQQSRLELKTLLAIGSYCARSAHLCSLCGASDHLRCAACVVLVNWSGGMCMLFNWSRDVVCRSLQHALH